MIMLPNVYSLVCTLNNGKKKKQFIHFLATGEPLKPNIFRELDVSLAQIKKKYRHKLKQQQKKQTYAKAISSEFTPFNI